METTTTPAKETTMHTIAMKPASDYRRSNYGVLLESETRHPVAGRGFHNPHHHHTIEVWENRRGTDPFGKPTDQAHTILMNAQASCISAHPQAPVSYGETLRVGDRVQLEVGGFPIGEYVIQAGYLRDPILLPAS